MRRAYLVALAACLLAACEEGPEQIYTPNPPDTDFNRFNGWKPQGFVNEGTQPFTSVSSGQKSGSVTLCQADELKVRWTKMVKEPVLPTVGAGGLNLKGKPEWSGLTVDQAQQQLCQAYVYDTEIVYWGDNAELLAFFDSKTRLIDRLVTFTGYEGTLKAGPYEIANNKPIMKDGKAFTTATSDDAIRAMNIELLKAFRPEVKNPETRDCVAQATCYVMNWYTLKRFVFNDVMLDFAIEPEESKIDHIGINLKRSFDFGRGDVKFQGPPTPTVGLPPLPTIDANAIVSGCLPTLGQTWGHIQTKCLGIDSENKALAQPVWSNEGLLADMGGLTVYLTRQLDVDKNIPDSAKPEAADAIIGLGFNSTYEGKLLINRADLYSAFITAVVAAAKAAMPTINEVALADRMALGSKLKIKTDADKLPLGTQRISDCASSPCVDTTLTIRARELVLAQAAKVGTTVPDKLKDPNFYVEIFLRQLLMVFNEGKDPSATEAYFYFGDDTAQTMYGRLLRKIGDDRYGVAVVYHNKSDQLLNVFFKKGALRTEAILYKDAELSATDGVFRLWNLATSTRLGVGVENFKPSKIDQAAERALLSLNLGGTKAQVLVSYHKEDSVSGYSIPVEGQRDLFMPAAYYGFTGSFNGASIWASSDGAVKAVSSGSFFDKLTFCGVKVGLFDPVDELLKAIPASCDKIVTYSANGKFIYALSTYVSDSPRLGLRLYITANRVDSAYIWSEE